MHPKLPEPAFMCSTVVPEDTATYTADQVLKFAQAVRRAALEEAAKAAEDTDTVDSSSYYAQLGDARATRMAIVEAILALAGDGSSNA